MRLASIVFFTAFFSVEISAQEEIVLWHTTFKRSSINFSSAEIRKNFKVTEVTNMPPVRSQDKVSICYAFAATTILQRYRCDQYRLDCTDTLPERTISPIGVMTLLTGNQSNKAFSITIFESGATILENSERLNNFKPEACFPFAEFQKVFGSDDEKIQKTVETLKSSYTKNRLGPDATETCAACLAKAKQTQSEIETLLRTSTLMSRLAAKELNTASFLIALKATSFESYMYQVFNTCDINSIKKPSHKFNGFPSEIGLAAKNEYIDKVVEGLALNTPVLFEGACLKLKKMTTSSEEPFYSNPGYTCSDVHTVVISDLLQTVPREFVKLFLKFITL